VQYEDIKVNTASIGRMMTQVSDERQHWVRCGFVDANGEGGPEYGYATGSTVTAGATDGWYGNTFLTSGGPQALLNTREIIGYLGPSGATVVAGGLNGQMLMARHGGDNAQGNYALFNMGWYESENKARLRVHVAPYVNADSAVYDGSALTTITLTGSPTLDTGPIAESSMRLKVYTGALAGTEFTVDTYNGTGTVVVDGDASGIGPSDDLALNYKHHPDCWQFVFSSSENANAIYNRGLCLDQETSHTQLPQYPGGAGSISNLAIQLVGFDGGDGQWEETYTNAVFRQVTQVGGSTTNSGGGSRCPMIDTVIDNVITGFTGINTHVNSGSLGIASTSGSVGVGYTATLRPDDGGVLDARLYLPRLPYDARGHAVPRDGTGAIGALQVALTPGVLSVDDYDHNSADLSWTDATDTTGTLTEQAQVSTDYTGDPETATWDDVSGATDSPASATGLTPETGYAFSVLFTDDNGAVRSNVVEITTEAAPAGDGFSPDGVVFTDRVFSPLVYTRDIFPEGVFD
jgi:hypothetical protein